MGIDEQAAEAREHNAPRSTTAVRDEIDAAGGEAFKLIDRSLIPDAYEGAPKGPFDRRCRAS